MAALPDVRRGIDFYAMSEDLPSPESRVMVDAERVVLKWVRTNWQAHLDLVAKLKAGAEESRLPGRARAGLRQTDALRISAATVRIGNDPGQAPLDVYCPPSIPESLRRRCRFLPTSAAVNPALTVAPGGCVSKPIIS
ncbi:hypothetical protein F2981_05595 [Sinorhizobium meliloti]|nr:hypothetical protein [Sinorhizobium meliloti]